MPFLPELVLPKAADPEPYLPSAISISLAPERPLTGNFRPSISDDFLILTWGSGMVGDDDLRGGAGPPPFPFRIHRGAPRGRTARQRRRLHIFLVSKLKFSHSGQVHPRYPGKTVFLMHIQRP